jgi:hypothetical protein
MLGDSFPLPEGSNCERGVILKRMSNLLVDEGAIPYLVHQRNHSGVDNVLES